MNTVELFELITSSANWHVGFCADSTARVWVHRHNKNKLTLDAYERMFNHFGYKLNEKWVKSES